MWLIALTTNHCALAIRLVIVRCWQSVPIMSHREWLSEHTAEGGLQCRCSVVHSPRRWTTSKAWYTPPQQHCPQYAQPQVLGTCTALIRSLLTKQTSFAALQPLMAQHQAIHKHHVGGLFTATHLSNIALRAHSHGRAAPALLQLYAVADGWHKRLGCISAVLPGSSWGDQHATTNCKQ